MSLEITTFHFPVRLIQGKDSLSKLGEEVKKAGASRVMVVTDKGIRAAGLLSGAGLENLRGLYAEMGFPEAIMANPFSKEIPVKDRVDKVWKWSGRLMKSNPRQATAEDVTEIFRRVIG